MLGSTSVCLGQSPVFAFLRVALVQTIELLCLSAGVVDIAVRWVELSSHLALPPDFALVWVETVEELKRVVLISFSFSAEVPKVHEIVGNLILCLAGRSQVIRLGNHLNKSGFTAMRLAQMIPVFASMADHVTDATPERAYWYSRA